MLAALAVAAPATANFVATATDPAGDAADPGRDITAAGMAYDRRTGRLSAALRLRGTPSTRSFITLVAGVRTATGCNGYPAAGFGSYSDELDASWLRLDGESRAGPRGEADKVGGGTTVQTFETEQRGLVGGRWSCVSATVTEPGNARTVYDSLGPFTLVGQPGLSLTVRGVPKRFERNRSRRLKIRVSNTGDGPARGVKVRLAKARGLRAAPRAKSLGTIAPGRHKTVSVRVKLVRGARTLTKLGVRAGAGKLVARRTVDLRLRTPRRRGGGGGGGGRGGSCVRFLPDLSGETGGSLILVPC